MRVGHLNPTREALLRKVWTGGDLSYLLHPGQLELRSAYLSSDSRKFVLRCARRWGKSRWLTVLGLEKCLQKPGSWVRFAVPEKAQAEEIVEEHMDPILDDCPAELRPEHQISKSRWAFPNGSRFVLAGCDGKNARRLRGKSTDLGMVDEAGDVDRLEYVVRSVLMPSTATTNGRVIISSTPSVTPAHPFDSMYCVEAEAEGYYYHRTIYDAPHITPEDIDDLKKESGGELSSHWIREYLARPILDDALAVIPEWTAAKEVCVAPHERPARFDTYVVGDFGFNDLTVVLFGYYDFLRDWIVIEDEVVFRNTAYRDIAPVLLAKERELWRLEDGTTAGTPGEPWKGPKRRIADCTLQERRDLSKYEGWAAYAPEKFDSVSAINITRAWVGEQRIRVHPRCRTLIAHLGGAIWNKSRKSFERSGEYGHFDALDALKYFVRHVNRGRNPYEPNPHARRDTHHIPPQTPSQMSSELRKLRPRRARR
ncbi:MAG: hypothetical protein AAGH15_11490 [Myxococcota bacterium]